MKREYVDDTVLLPVLQYILNLFQTRSQNEAFEELEAYKELIRSNKLFAKWYDDNSMKSPTALDELFECIEAYRENPISGKRQFHILSGTALRCGLCKDCNNCVKAFAYKIYEALSSDEIIELRPSNDFEYEKLPSSVEKHLRANATEITKYYDELRL